MDSDRRTAVFFYLPQNGLAAALDMQALSSYAAQLPGVAQVEKLSELKGPDPGTLSDLIQRNKIQRIVLAGPTPGKVKPAFSRAMAEAGRDPGEVRLATFGNSPGLDRITTERAQAMVACAVYGVPFSLAALPGYAEVCQTTLVIGGGVAGIQAALEIADAGKDVVLVEKAGTIGGHMAMFDKTFPTLDCAACILTPKMVSVSQHEKIELMTYSEVETVSGSPGDYRVTIRNKARCVDIRACVACNICSEVCPIQAPSEFDDGIATRKAIYIPFPQAIPNAFLVDTEACIYIQSDGKKCGACLKKCPKECIDLFAEDQFVEVQAGNVILATGYKTYDAGKVERYGYGEFPNVLTALEFERLTNASGPTGGRIVLKTKKRNRRKKCDEWVFDPEGPAPRSVAIVHCVGSRDANHNDYCSRVCCMYSLKFAHLVKEKLPDATCHEFYIDMRAFGKDYEAFFERIKGEGVYVIRGRSARVSEKEGQMLIRAEDITSSRVLDLPVDMVLLSVGLVPHSSTRDLAEKIGLHQDADGWFSERDYNTDPTGTEIGGVFVAGVCQGPKDIPDTVAQASAVASRVLKSLVSGQVRTSRNDLSLEEIAARAKALANA